MFEYDAQSHMSVTEKEEKDSERESPMQKLDKYDCARISMFFKQQFGETSKFSEKSFVTPCLQS